MKKRAFTGSWRVAFLFRRFRTTPQPTAIKNLSSGHPPPNEFISKERSPRDSEGMFLDSRGLSH